MKIFIPILMISSILFAKEPSQELLTQYYTRNTISEVVLGNTYSNSIYKTFELNEHRAFFSKLEILSREKQRPEIVQNFPQDYAYIYAKKIEPNLKKLHSSIGVFCKKYPSTKIASLLKTWSSFNFSKEEKETLSYFNELKRKTETSDSTFLERELISILSQYDLMKSAFKDDINNCSSFYLDHGDYLLELYTHKKMLELLDHSFEPAVFHHIETYLLIAKKKAAFFYDTKLLHQIIQGDLALSNEAESAAKDLLKPQLKKLDSYLEEIEFSNERKKI